VVLVAFVLVLLAAASFAAGIAASRTSDTLVYLSILFSLAAFVVLAIASFRARQAEREAGAGAAGPWGSSTGTIDEAEAHAGPLLGGLDPTQLDMTPSWRRQRRGRFDDPVLDAQDAALEAQLENEEDEADFEVPVAPLAASTRSDEFGWGIDGEGADEAEEGEEEDEEEPTTAFTPAFDEHDEVGADDMDDADDVLDIPQPEPAPTAVSSFFDEYDDMTAAEILPFLRALDVDGLKWVRSRERSGAKRATVVNQVEQLIVEQGGKPSPASTRKRPAAKKAAPAKKAAQAKKAAPARRTAKKSTRRR
jgi:hypothetical protein